jgi:hypothetical protein
VAFFERLKIKRDGPREISHVITITLNVPFQLGQGDVVRGTREEPQMLKGSRKHLRQSLSSTGMTSRALQFLQPAMIQSLRSEVGQK